MSDVEGNTQLIGTGLVEFVVAFLPPCCRGVPAEIQRPNDRDRAWIPGGSYGSAQPGVQTIRPIFRERERSMPRLRAGY